jgi:hypothetical protein
MGRETSHRDGPGERPVNQQRTRLPEQLDQAIQSVFRDVRQPVSLKFGKGITGGHRHTPSGTADGWMVDATTVRRRSAGLRGDCSPATQIRSADDENRLILSGKRCFETAFPPCVMAVARFYAVHNRRGTKEVSRQGNAPETRPPVATSAGVSGLRIPVSSYGRRLRPIWAKKNPKKCRWLKTSLNS